MRVKKTPILCGLLVLLMLPPTASTQYKVWLPDVPVYSGGHDISCSFYVRNDGSSATTLRTYLYDRDGTPFDLEGAEEQTVYENGRTIISLVGSYGRSLHGYLEASQPITAIMIYTQFVKRDVYAAYMGIDATRTTTAPLVPLVFRGHQFPTMPGETWYSRLVIQNAGSGDTTFDVDFRPAASTAVTYFYDNLSLEANESLEIPLRDHWLLGGSFRGSATIVGSEQKLAVTVTHEAKSGAEYRGLMATAHSTARTGSAVFAPIMHNNNGGWYGDLAVLNGSSSGNSKSLYQFNGGSWQYIGWYLAGRSLQILDTTHVDWPKVWSGHTWWGIWGNSNQSAVAVQTRPSPSHNGGAGAYAASDWGSRKVILPYLNTRDDNFWGGFVISNPNGSGQTVTIKFYNNPQGSPGVPLKVGGNDHQVWIPAWGEKVILPGVGNGFIPPMHGSAVVTAPNPIVVAVNFQHTDDEVRDTLFSYSGNPR